MRTSNNEMSSESSPAWMLALPSRKRMSSKYGWECFSKFQMRLCSSKRSQNFSSARSSEMDSRKARVGFGDMVTPGERTGGLRDVACPRTRLSWPDREAAEKSGRPARFVLGRGRELVPQPHGGRGSAQPHDAPSRLGASAGGRHESFENTDLSQSLLNWSDFVRVSFAAADLHDSDLRCSNFDRCDCPPRTCRPRREPPRAAPAWDLTRARPPSHRSAPCLLAWRSPCVAIAVPPVGDALDYARRSEWRARRGPLFLMTRCSGAVRTAAAWPASSPKRLSGTKRGTSSPELASRRGRSLPSDAQRWALAGPGRLSPSSGCSSRASDPRC